MAEARDVHRLFDEIYLHFIPPYAVFDDMVKYNPEKPALISGVDRKKMSYQELQEKSQRFANALQKIGVKKGDRVIICLPNCFQFVISFLALNRIGAVAILLGPRERTWKIKEVVSKSQAKVAICSDDKVDDFDFLRKSRRSSLEHIVNVHLSPGPFKSSSSFHFPLLVAENSPDFSPVNIVPEEDAAVIIYKTRGKELVGISHSNVTAAIYQLGKWFLQHRPEIFSSPEERAFVFAPFEYPGLVSLLFSLTAGCSSVVFPKLYSDELKRGLVRWKNHSFLWTTPGLLNELIKDFQRPDLSFLRFIGVLEQSFNPFLEKNLYEKLAGEVEIIRILGFPEAFPMFIGLSGGAFSEVEGMEVRVKMGEFLVAGPQVFRGYWRDKVRTEAERKNGFWRSGLAGKKNGGSIIITDQIRNELIYSSFGGEVSPQEVEMVLESHPGVKQAIVVGKRTKKKQIEEEVIALVILRRESELTEKDLINYCRSLLKPEEVPSRIEILNLYSKGGRKSIVKIMKKTIMG